MVIVFGYEDLLEYVRLEYLRPGEVFDILDSRHASLCCVVKLNKVGIIKLNNGVSLI